MRRAFLLILSASIIGFAGCGDGDETGGGGGTTTTDGGGSDGPSPIHVVAFDEHDETLQAIIDGEMHGTVVQNPYGYGYESVRILAGLARKQEGMIPENEYMDLPARQIRAADAGEFWKDKNGKLAAGEGEAELKDGRPTVAYVTNGIDPFWTVASAGAKTAGNEFDVNVLLRYPPKGVADQKAMIEALLAKDEVTGVAVSPIDPRTNKNC